jgi:type I restriction enzyme S subunit
MLASHFEKTKWAIVEFGNVVVNINATSKNPVLEGLSRVVGLDDMDSESLPLRRWSEIGDLPDGTTFTRKFSSGQVLFGKRRSYQKKVSVPYFDGVCSGDILVFEANNKKMLNEFLPLVVQSADFMSHAIATSAGSLSPRTKWSDLAKYQFCLPSLKDQEKIIEIVSSIDKTIEAYQDLPLRSQRESMLHELLTAGGDDWNETTLGQTLELTRGGSPRPIQDFITSSDDGVNWIKIGDASSSSKYIYHTAQKIRPEGVSRSRAVKSGDFILSNSMSFGRPYIMRTDGCIHDGWLLLSNVEKYFNEDFLYNLLLSDLVQKQFDSLAAGSGVRNLNIEVVKEVTVLLPPIKQQEEIAKVANLLDEVNQSTEMAIQDLKALRRSLLTEILSVNDNG